MVAKLASTRIKFVIGNPAKQAVHHLPKLFAARGKGDKQALAGEFNAIAITHIIATAERP